MMNEFGLILDIFTQPMFNSHFVPRLLLKSPHWQTEN